MLAHWREAVPDDRLAHLVRDAARALTRSLSIRLAEYHVSFGHWAFLRVLWVRDGLTQRELSERAGVMEPTTFSAINTMERLGYVARRRRKGDRRKIFIHLTPKGRELEKTLVPLAEEVNRVAIDNVKPQHVATTRAVLLAIIENLVSDEGVSAKPLPSTRVIAKLAKRRSKI
jgi:DNA-binding MarR family transcriptional regulator